MGTLRYALGEEMLHLSLSSPSSSHSPPLPPSRHRQLQNPPPTIPVVPVVPVVPGLEHGSPQTRRRAPSGKPESPREPEWDRGFGRPRVGGAEG